MQTNSHVLEQRKIRNAKYAAEDFYTAVGQLRNVGIGHIFLLLIMGISLTFEAQNTIHFIFSILTAIACFVIYAKLPLTQNEAIYTGMGIYFFLVVLEFSIGGLPDPVSPALADHSRWEGGEITRILNALSPFLYVAFRFVFVYPFLMIMNKLTLAKRHPKQYMQRAGFSEF